MGSGQNEAQQLNTDRIPSIKPIKVMSAAPEGIGRINMNFLLQISSVL
ncbi:hypothetical protein HALOI3_60163 [Halomonas sp. I3]|jgi:hypothetical protein|nr:hypothetical protein HALOI3_60163 [Halomonas sp. I3]